MTTPKFRNLAPKVLLNPFVTPFIISLPISVRLFLERDFNIVLLIVSF